MPKIIAIGDTHGRANWKVPFYNEEWVAGYLLDCSGPSSNGSNWHVISIRNSLNTRKEETLT